MLLALALYASTAHENAPHYDLDLLYHDGKAHRLDNASQGGQGRGGMRVGDAEDGAPEEHARPHGQPGTQDPGPVARPLSPDSEPRHEVHDRGNDTLEGHQDLPPKR
jgi:hypothetical protein